MLKKEGGAHKIKFAEMVVDPAARRVNTKQLVKARADSMTAAREELKRPDVPKGVASNEAECSSLVAKVPSAVLCILVAVSLVPTGEALDLESGPLVPHHHGAKKTPRSRATDGITRLAIGQR